MRGRRQKAALPRFFVCSMHVEMVVMLKLKMISRDLSTSINSLCKAYGRNVKNRTLIVKFVFLVLLSSYLRRPMRKQETKNKKQTDI